MIDLHVHTNVSDGSFCPREVVRMAANLGIKAIALTDHDSVAGITEAQIEGSALGVEVLSGVEISTEWDNGILHLLGYFVNPNDPDLLSALGYLKNGRQERIPKIISKLNDQNVHITVEEVCSEATGGVPGRPHVANVLLKKEYVKTRQEAFDRFLKKGASAYVEKVKLPVIKSIEVIKKAGGIPVLAHPYSLGGNHQNRLEETIQYLVSHGLKGIEVFYPEHTPEQVKIYIEIAERFDLVITGGTDFHGANKPEVKLGSFPSWQQPMSYSIVEELKKRA